MRNLKYYTYRTQDDTWPATLVSSEHPDSIRSRFRFGESELTEVTEEVYKAALRRGRGCNQG